MGIKIGRRDWIIGGAATLGVGGIGAAGMIVSRPVPKIPPLPAIGTVSNTPLHLLRDFDYGTIKEENGQRFREFRIEAQVGQIALNSVVTFNTWNYNGRIPGPTLRATAGDRVRVIFFNKGGHAHSMHFHGFHPAAMDGVRPVRNGTATVYEFTAEPYGLHLYHCHVAPVTRHVGKGLYGMFIIDPPGGRDPADEMILVMGGYDTNDDGKNEFYAFNGLPNYYLNHPIPIALKQKIRLYLLNMIEWDPVVTFHLHATMFGVIRTGMGRNPTEETDVITMGTAERHILEFSYPYPGMYMFHPHQDAIAEQGCMGHFEVREDGAVGHTMGSHSSPPR